ncbi:MAG: hypothetical protein M1819_004179 [Sarea resinae]|nr:MAG: hypothetical protein M1819_004179 [Sarea resinae]
MPEQRNIVVIGGAFSGIAIAHNLLRHVLPELDVHATSTSGNSYRVTLISPSTHFYWKIGAPRALISADALPREKTFMPIADGFKEYPSALYEFIHGTVTKLDPDTHQLTIKPEDGPTANAYTLPYHAVILATGRQSHSPLFSLHGPHTRTVAALEEMHSRLPTAQSIVVAGGGAAGVETAGELGSAFGKKKDILLLSGSSRLLPSLRADIGARAEKYLRDLGVEVVHGVRVTSVSSQTTLHLDDSTTRSTDVYIDATGGDPNTSFLPPAWLEPNGTITTSPTTLRVTPAFPGTLAYALGDVTSFSKGSILDVWEPVPALTASLEHDLYAAEDALDRLPDQHVGQDGTDKKDAAHASASARVAPAEILYAQAKSDTMIVPVGRSKGVGVAFGWWLPSLLIWWVKGRTFMAEKMAETVMGDKFR